MTFSLFLESIPPFVWVGLISMVVCFFVGYLSCPAVMESRKQGFRSDSHINHDLDVMLWTSCGLAFMTTITCFKYSVPMPESLFFRLMFVPLLLAGTFGLMLLFWGISAIAANVYYSTHSFPKRR